MSRGALLLLLVSGLLLGPPVAPAQEKEGPVPSQRDGSPPAGEERSPGGAEREGSDKVGKERRPEPQPDDRPEGPALQPPALDPEALRIGAQVREIQLALLDEIVRVEQRLAVVRRKLELELGLPGPPLGPGAPGSRGIAPGPGPEGGASPGIPRKQARKALRVPPAPQDLEEERRYRALLEREREIVTQWKRAGARRSKAEGKEAEEAALRAELERVLREILDLREKARERQVDRLRRELEDIERALEVREDEKERERLVNSRMRELLGR